MFGGDSERTTMKQRMRRRKDSAPDIDENDATEQIAVQQQSVSTHFSFQQVFSWAIVFRIVDAFLVGAYFNPDEYWQSLEVAHRMVFGCARLVSRRDVAF